MLKPPLKTIANKMLGSRPCQMLDDSQVLPTLLSSSLLHNAMSLADMHSASAHHYYHF